MNEVLVNIKQGDFAVITLNRPNQMNAISISSISQLKESLSTLPIDELKFLVITGQGDQAFCSGGDLNDFHSEMSEKEAYQRLKEMQDVLYQIATLPIPTIAWMNGKARGGGLEIASACDLRFAQMDADFGFVQGQLGISTGWGGGSLLYERIHPQFAFEWLLKADVRNVEELKAIGFIQNVFTDKKISYDSSLLKPYINRSVQQMKIWKRQRLNQISLIRLKQQMEDEVKSCSTLWGSHEHKEAIRRFFYKNKK